VFFSVLFLFFSKLNLLEEQNKVVQCNNLALRLRSHFLPVLFCCKTRKQHTGKHVGPKVGPSTRSNLNQNSNVWVFMCHKSQPWKRKISLKWQPQWLNDYKYLKSWSIYSDLFKKRRMRQGLIVFDKKPHSYIYAITQPWTRTVIPSHTKNANKSRNI